MRRRVRIRWAALSGTEYVMCRLLRPMRILIPERRARLTKILKDAFDDEPKPKLVAIRANGV